MEIGLVQKINIDEEMQQAYLDYAMSVIVARALPDARDGLKPVHRRILYAMHDMGIRPDTPYKKSARIVGEVLGKYHPHGDMAVYDAMARMAQDFSMRYLLVDGQGNFGSVDGDAPAAMRYTEARLASISEQMLADLHKNTVDFDANFDATLFEPRVLPSAAPNLLVNGATGIAVGMATSIPPHNLGEVVDALHYMLERWEKMDDISVEDLMAFVEGPDFPTGGIIIHDEDSDGLISAYSTGRGRVTVQASAHLEEMERGRNRIIVNELPYLTNKSSLIERIASLVREERLEGIADLRDESDRQGMRIVIELNKAADPEKVLAELYKNTPMQSTFSIIMLALVDGEPRVLSLKHALRVFIEHRLEIVRRRSEFDLEKARQRAHILEGLLVALHNLDEIIALIRKSPDAETARDRMIKRFKLTLLQAQAILDMQLRRLAALERKKIEEEYKETQALIKELEALLRSPKKMRQVVDQELQVVKETYADRRRTHIARVKAGASKVSLLTASDLKPDQLVWVSVSKDGLIARSLDEKPPRYAAKDAPRFLSQANTRDTLYLVTEQGEAAALPVHALPEAVTPDSGLPLNKVSALKEGQPLAALFSLPAKERRAENGIEGFVLTATRLGMLKKSPLSELPGPSASAFTLVKVNPEDRLGWVRLTKGDADLLLVSAAGMAIRFNEDEVRPMGLAAAGVMGIKLQPADRLAGAEVLPAAAGELFLLASDGSAKRVPLEQFTRQGRHGQGLIAWKLPPKVQILVAVAGAPSARIILHLAKLAPKTLRLDEAPQLSRTSRGQFILEAKETAVEAICVPWEPALAAPASSPRKTTRAPSAKAPAKTAAKATAKAAPETTAKATPAKAPTAAPSAKAPAKTAAKAAPETTAKATAAKAPTATPSAKAPAKTAAKAAPETTAKATTAKAPTATPSAKAPAKTAAKATPETTAKATAAKAPTAAPSAKPPAKTAAKTPTATPSAKPPAKTAAKAAPETTAKKVAAKAPTETPSAKPPAKTAAKAAPETTARATAAKAPTVAPSAKVPAKTAAKTPTETPSAKAPAKTAAKTPTETPSAKTPAKTAAKATAKAAPETTAKATAAKGPTAAPSAKPPAKTAAKAAPETTAKATAAKGPTATPSAKAPAKTAAKAAPETAAKATAAKTPTAAPSAKPPAKTAAKAAPETTAKATAAKAAPETTAKATAAKPPVKTTPKPPDANPPAAKKPPAKKTGLA